MPHLSFYSVNFKKKHDHSTASRDLQKKTPTALLAVLI